MPRNRVQSALRQRKQDEANASLVAGQQQEKAYDCFFHHDTLPSPMENGTLCILIDYFDWWERLQYPICSLNRRLREIPPSSIKTRVFL
ncbi:hypothetical protein B5F88_10735 [Flavonifractor sp. An306]|nr:hypothetical protein B5F88_10735 [Flavonifractor sp. An306]